MSPWIRSHEDSPMPVWWPRSGYNSFPVGNIYSTHSVICFLLKAPIKLGKIKDYFALWQLTITCTTDYPHTTSSNMNILMWKMSLKGQNNEITIFHLPRQIVTKKKTFLRLSVGFCNYRAIIQRLTGWDAHCCWHRRVSWIWSSTAFVVWQ